MNTQQIYKMFLYHVRNLSTSSSTYKSKSFYDSLGVTPKATQADVKSAYYKLSKVYHPDTNKGNKEDAEKFRDICEAYEVLGNVKTRKLYDKGFFIREPTSADDPFNKFYKSRETRSRPPPPSGRTPIYDFDEWARAHYGATFAKDMEIKRRRKMYEKLQEENKHALQQEKFLFLSGLLLVICMYVTSVLEDRYDKVRKIEKNKNTQNINGDL